MLDHLKLDIDYGTPKRESVKEVTLEIDGQQVTVPEGTSIMRAAVDAGVKVPKLCAMGGMTPFPVLSALNHYPEDFGLSKPDRKAA